MILTVTPNPALDYTIRLDRSLDPGAIARTNRTRLDPGGKGINVSAYLDALAVPTTATGFLGGQCGALLRRQLAGVEFATDFVDVDGETRINTTILAADGEYKVNQDGPQVAPADRDALVDLVHGMAPDVVVVGGSRPPGVGVGMIDRLAAGDWDTIVDVDGTTLRSLDDGYTLCTPNRAELARATGQPTDTIEDCADAADALRSRGFTRVIVSMGDEGAILVDDDHRLHARPPDVEVVGTVGAGDSLLAGFLAGIERDEAPTEALRTAVAVSACVVGVAGTTVPDFTDLSARRKEVRVTSTESRSP